MTLSSIYRPHVVFAGGVTGGHLFPGLAVAEQLAEQNSRMRITFAGPGTAFDREMVARAGHEYFEIACPRMPRGIAASARFTYDMLRGCGTATTFLGRTGVSVVVGLGGFASVPTALAAARLRKPLLLLEQNAVVGRANRRLARWCSCLCLGFDDTSWAPGRTELPGYCSIVATGTPVRATFLTEKSAGESGSILLILGGSGGSRWLNQNTPIALAAIRQALAGWRVVHQTGPNDVTATASAYQAAGIKATVAPFLDDLPTILAESGLAVCRAGGSTLAELAVVGVPAVLVPLAGATDNHQTRNALALSSAGAAVTVDGDQRHVQASQAAAGPFAELLRVAIASLVADAQRRRLMSAAIRRFARPDAARRIARLVLMLADASGDAQRPASASFPCLPVLH